MNFLKLIGSSLFQVLSITFLLCYILGIFNNYFSSKNNYCDMTYMFEYPQFVKITVPENVLFPQYGLYAYSEGRFTERARKMWFDGVPVLFVPGNSGSHMQARSLASVALRKGLSYDYHFDFFTIGYNEELSGLYGGVLGRQTRFASACISRILSLYKSNKYTKTVPTSVILIGHSMGGLIAKRLLAYPDTLHTTNIAITLAAPLLAPVINVDMAMDQYYKEIDEEWQTLLSNPEVNDRKMLISLGNGVRDMLMPPGLTSSNESFVNALTTSIPGVWLSPDHVSIVWCKQLVLVLNRFLFRIVDPNTSQVSDDKQLWMKKATQYLLSNRSMTLNPKLVRENVTMLADAFWYEDNRRIYQIQRPEIEKTTYLMIRLVSFPQNRFVAIQGVNVDNHDWLFACNVDSVYHSHRYCKQATSLGELSRWTGAAATFGKRKLATVHLHSLLEYYPQWTHVIVKVAPTRKPIVLNVDINDYASRHITVDAPSDFSFGPTVIKAETEPNSLYYEIALPGFDSVSQAYLLYVEPTANCKATQYHVSAEMHVPWADNHEVYHYFTQTKRSPMKLRLFRTNPNVTMGLQPTQQVTLTLLLDPQCTFTISISSSWYYRLAQFARNYTAVLIPYVAAVVLLAVRSNMQHASACGRCASVHAALMSDGVKPYYVLVFARLANVVIVCTPVLSFLLETANSRNLELQYFTRSLLVVPAYMVALGVTNVAVTAVLVLMVFSSQLAHRLLFRIVWRGGSGLAERLAAGLQKVPMLVSAALVCAVPLSCGAAALAAGAAFYAFMLSKMYEEYLEDYVYKLMAKVASRVCRMFVRKRGKEQTETGTVSLVENTETSFETTESSVRQETKALEVVKDKETNEDDKIEITGAIVELMSLVENTKTSFETTESSVKQETKALEVVKDKETNEDDKIEITSAIVEVNKPKESKNVVNTMNEDSYVEESKSDSKRRRRRGSCKTQGDIDEELNSINFHMMLFLLWMVVTLVNVPALLSWARNFKYSMVLKPDTSYHTGFVMSACSAVLWQMDGPRRNLRHYDALSSLLFTTSVFILTLGPISLAVVNYGVTAIFAIITLQQVFDKEDPPITDDPTTERDEKTDENAKKDTKSEEKSSSETDKKDNKEKDQEKSRSTEPSDDKQQSADESASKKSDLNSETVENTEDCVCNESRIYGVFKNLRDKFTFNEDL